MADKRYDYTKIEKNKFGDRTYSTTLYPEIKKRNDDIYIRSKDGDRLDNLAYKYYNNSALWWIIAQANHIGKGTLLIESGIQLRIPTNLSAIIADLEEINK
tara:strand:- start:183 stop:485 length:303 start_codon:yes stop_codon:yes gene_type:complete